MPSSQRTHKLTSLLPSQIVWLTLLLSKNLMIALKRAVLILHIPSPKQEMKSSDLPTKRTRTGSTRISLTFVNFCVLKIRLIELSWVTLPQITWSSNGRIREVKHRGCYEQWKMNGGLKQPQPCKTLLMLETSKTSTSPLGRSMVQSIVLLHLFDPRTE